MTLSGRTESRIRLRPATLDDRRMIYDWMAHSDLTEQMMGPPEFIDHPVPTWEDFIADYKDVHFTGEDPSQGRSFIIELDGLPVGHINHGVLQADGTTELDIWLAARQYTGHGYGTTAIHLLCEYLSGYFGCTRFLMAPSLRNTAAVRSYMKAGFVPSEEIPEWFLPDYPDTLVMIRDEKQRSKT